MAGKRPPSYTQLVYDVLQSAEKPLTVREIMAEVARRRRLTTRDPEGTIRSALSQGKQLVSLGDGRYGHLAKLLRGSLVRQPLTQKKPANHPLIFPEEVRQLLFPSFFEIALRRDDRPAQVRLPDGEQVLVHLVSYGRGTWGSDTSDGLRRYLVDQRADAGDGLLIRVFDADARQYEARFESRLKRNQAVVGARNSKLADAAYSIVRSRGAREVPVWDLVVLLLGRGHYRSDVAPDPLEEILAADPRLRNVGFDMWMLVEHVTPEIEAAIPRRRRLEAELFGGSAADGEAELEEFSPLLSRRSMERVFADLAGILAEHDFQSAEEATAFIQNLLAEGGVPPRQARTPLEQAQHLVYDAWDSPDPRERVRLAEEALHISADCADAYVVLAEETADTAAEAAALHAEGVAAAERALGLEAFAQAEAEGAFWGMIETRPYMRARLGLAMALWDMGRHEEAVAHAWEMLRLNPNDNQGVRYVLLDWLLELGDDAQVEKLLALYDEDPAATWLYGRALHAFRTEHGTQRARELLAEAQEFNPHVPAYLLRRKRLPSTMPATYGFGDVSEAIVCAAEQMRAWQKASGALRWLARHAS